MAKYDPLNLHLRNSNLDCLVLDVSEIAGLVGGLPKSAFTYRPWWGNEANGSHVQAHAWIGAGYQVSDVKMGIAVTFERRV